MKNPLGMAACIVEVGGLGTAPSADDFEKPTKPAALAGCYLLVVNGAGTPARHGAAMGFAYGQLLFEALLARVA